MRKSRNSSILDKRITMKKLLSWRENPLWQNRVSYVPMHCSPKPGQQRKKHVLRRLLRDRKLWNFWRHDGNYEQHRNWEKQPRERNKTNWNFCLGSWKQGSPNCKKILQCTQALNPVWRAGWSLSNPFNYLSMMVCSTKGRSPPHVCQCLIYTSASSLRVTFMSSQII